jgi:hypothetical protein
MTNTIGKLSGRICGREAKRGFELAKRRPAVVVELMEGRLLMSGDPVLTTEIPSTALLLPAVQAAREAARRSVTDGTSNTILVGESYRQPTYGTSASYQIITAGTT